MESSRGVAAWFYDRLAEARLRLRWYRPPPAVGTMRRPAWNERWLTPAPIVGLHLGHALYELDRLEEAERVLRDTLALDAAPRTTKH